jgi:hypothetical protein
MFFYYWNLAWGIFLIFAGGILFDYALKGK